jgi:hypothetical protein
VPSLERKKEREREREREGGRDRNKPRMQNFEGQLMPLSGNPFISV